MNMQCTLHRCMKCSVILIGQWNFNFGHIELVHKLYLAKPLNTCTCISNHILTIRKDAELTTLPHFIIRALSNKTVFTGKSTEPR